MTTVAGTRRGLYRGARLLGDAQAARRGPAAYGRRLARKQVYRRTGSLGRRISKLLGL